MGILDDLIAQQGGAPSEPTGLDQLMENLRKLFTGDAGGQPASAASAPRMGAESAPAPRVSMANSGGSPGTDAMGGVSDFFAFLRGEDPRFSKAATAKDQMAAYMQLSPDITPQMARAMATNPVFGKLMLDSIMGSRTPQIVDVPDPNDPYSPPAKYVMNPKTRKLDPISTIMGGATAPAASPVAASPASAEAAPMGAPTGVGQMSPKAQQFIEMIKSRGAPLGSENLAPDQFKEAFGQFGPSAEAAVPSAEPTAAFAQETPAVAASPQIGVKEVAGALVPKDKTPTGRVQKLTPDGQGVWIVNAAGKRMPAWESAAEESARSKGTEKKALDLADKEDVANNMSTDVKAARQMTDIPGFDQGLFLSRGAIDLPYVGKVNPMAAMNRFTEKAGDPGANAAASITQLQTSLNLELGRLFLKGQGSVSNFERSMVADAVGDLSTATTKAEFQFKLNVVQNMIDKIRGGSKIGAGDKNIGQPTMTELKTVWDKDGGMDEARLSAIADKYNVSRGDMQNHIIGIFNPSTRAPSPAQNMVDGLGSRGAAGQEAVTGAGTEAFQRLMKTIRGGQ